MNIQGFQKTTLLDYPGKVACIVFTGGCNLRCPFCHNGSLVRSPMSSSNMQQEVMDYISRRAGVLDGVCITGGEPLLQPDLGEFIAKAKGLGLAVKLDTNGALPGRLRKIIAGGNIDYIAMDIKSSPEGYAKASGSDADIELFRESVEIIKQSGIEHEFRTTAVKGIHSAEDFVAIARWIGPEEKYFIQKYVDSGDVLCPGYSSFTEAEYAEIISKVREIIPAVELRG